MKDVVFGKLKEKSDAKLYLNRQLNYIALRTAKTLWSFGRSECNRVKMAFHYIPLRNSIKERMIWYVMVFSFSVECFIHSNSTKITICPYNETIQYWFKQYYILGVNFIFMDSWMRKCRCITHKLIKALRALC